jgi:HSP20 family protein
MDFSKLAPWNWFKDEEENRSQTVPVKKKPVSLEHTDTITDIQRNFEDLFTSLRKDIEDAFAPLKNVEAIKPDWFKPSLDIASKDDEYSIELELPGVDLDNIDIEVENHTMSIKGEKRQETEEKDKDYHRIERSYGSFQRVLNLPADTDTDNIVSNYKDGILSITIPKKELPKKEVKKIQVESKSN